MKNKASVIKMSDDELVRKVSAFNGYDDMAKSMNYNDYVPTLSCRPLAQITESRRSDQAAVNVLADRLEAKGFRIYRGSRTYKGISGLRG